MLIIFLTSLMGILSVYGCSAIQFKKKGVPHLPLQAKFKKTNLALVLGAGGAKGFAHVGVIEELEKAGIVPDVIIGCSAGAIIGALYAAEPNIHSLKSVVLSGKNSDIVETNISEWPYSVYSHHKLIKYLHTNLKSIDFKNLKIPVVIAATNLQHGNLTAFSEGDIIQPILASAAYPGAFPAVKIEEQYFVDCGVSNPVPVQLARNLGFKKVIAVNISGQLPESSPNHIFGMLMRSIEISYINNARSAAENADVVINFDFKNIPVFSDQYNDYLYEAGKKATQHAMPKILTLQKKKQKIKRNIRNLSQKK